MKFYLTIACLILIFLPNCTDRNRTNPFDPGGNIKTPIQLSISPVDQSAVLNWTIQNITDFKGFRLYRAIDDDNFNLLRELPPETRTYNDTTLEFYHWYQYHITILGYLNESPPSKPVKLFPGPGKVWLLTRYGYSVRELSYDLLHTLKIYNTNYPPINWDLNLAGGEVWLAHAQYRYISKLDIDLGYEDFFFQNNFRQPLDIKIDLNADRINVLDPQSQKIFLLQNQTIEDSVHLDQDNYFKLIISNNSEMIVINENSVLIFDVNGDSLAAINFESGFSGKDILVENTRLYVLIANPGSEQTRIITYDLSSHRSDHLTFDGSFNLLAKPEGKDYFILSEMLSSSTSRLVKLSGQGNRLLELPILAGNIDDIAINKNDHSLVIVQRYQNNLVLYDSLGQIISVNAQFYDPIKIHIE